ncbi:MAG TPA: hypothetical protein V6D17_07595 [Candidatus Obscuribacterales bacterium]
MGGYKLLKKIIYLGETLFGIFLLLLAARLGVQPLPHGVIDTFTAIIVAVMGGSLLLFGITTFIIRKDEDVWR